MQLKNQLILWKKLQSKVSCTSDITKYEEKYIFVFLGDHSINFIFTTVSFNFLLQNTIFECYHSELLSPSKLILKLDCLVFRGNFNEAILLAEIDVTFKVMLVLANDIALFRSLL